jgi:hypothetical protein
VSASSSRQRTDRLRAIPLADILRAVGATPAPHDPVKWNSPRGVLSVNGSKFFNWNEAVGGGGAIDLTMHLKALGFKETIDWLAHRFALPPQDKAIAPAYALRRLVLPAPVADALPAVIRYLSAQRRLPLAQLQPLLDSGDLYADRNHNAVFLLRNDQHAPVGAELRGTSGIAWRGLAPGSCKDQGFFSCGPPDAREVVLCESAIDALSCCSLCPQRRCISTAGARPSPAWLTTLLSQQFHLYCGFDADPTGNTMAAAMLTLHPSIQRLRPSHHDWNDALRARS